MHLTEVVNFLRQVDELSTAKQLLDTFAKYATNIQQFDELGMLYEKIKSYPESLVMLEKCSTLTYEPQALYSIRANFAKIYNHLNEPLKSLEYSGLNLEVNPLDPETLMEQSFSYYLYGDFDRSWSIQNQLLERDDLSTKVRDRINYNMGSFEIAQGKFKSGMAKMILGGKSIGIWPYVTKPFERWDGKFTNKTILIYAEAGIGDQIINIRFVNEIIKQGMKPIWIGGDEGIRSLFKSNNYAVLNNDKNLDPFQEYVYCESTVLPVILDLDQDQLWNGPYLKPNQESINKWKNQLPKNFITIKWNGNPLYDQDLHRGVPVDQLIKAIRQKTNLPIVSLQIDENRYTGPEVINPEIKSWYDTLAIQHLAKLNITSCTSTAHSAGAIGSNTVVLPPICTYYPWITLKSDFTSYWYGDNLKAFVQTKWKNWDEPIAKACDQLNIKSLLD